MKKDSLLLIRKNHLGKEIRKNSLPKGFCSAPFTQMFLYPTGDVFVCCEGAGHLGNITESKIEDLWNGDKARQLRREFLSGNPIQCQKNIKCKGCNLNYDEQLPDIELSETQTQLPKYLDVVLNGKCNIDCIMCDVKNKVESLPAKPEYHTEIVEKIYPHLKEISLKSGEPLVQKETFDLINTLSNLNPKAQWKFTTNGQYSLNEKLKSELNKIEITRMTFSIDSMNEKVFGLIRKGGHLKKALQALADFKDFNVGKNQENEIEFAVNITVQKDNWPTSLETYSYFANQDIQPYFLLVEEPADLSLVHTTDEIKIGLLRYLLNEKISETSGVLQLYKCLESLFLSEFNIEIRKLRLLLEKQIVEFQKKKLAACTLPFTQLSIYPDGSLKPCCWLGDYALSEKGQNLDTKAAWSAAPIEKLRQQFNDRKVTICKDSIEKTSCQKNNLNRQTFLTPRGQARKQIPALHWYFSGKCNLSCPMCNNWPLSSDFPQAESSMQHLKGEVFPYLCELEVVGGEPFFQKRTFEMIDHLSLVNPYLSWIFTTNGQLTFQGAIANSLEKIYVTHLSVSIDSLDEKMFAEIRRGGLLEKSLQFLEQALQFRQSGSTKSKFRISINFVLQKKNYLELNSMIEFCQKKSVELFVIPLVTPSGESIYQLSITELNALLLSIDEIDTTSAVSNILEVKSRIKWHLQKNLGQGQLQIDRAF